MTLGAEDARGIETLMRFEKKRGYNRPKLLLKAMEK